MNTGSNGIEWFYFNMIVKKCHRLTVSYTAHISKRLLRERPPRISPAQHLVNRNDQQTWIGRWTQRQEGVQTNAESERLLNIMNGTHLGKDKVLFASSASMLVIVSRYGSSSSATNPCDDANESCVGIKEPIEDCVHAFIPAQRCSQASWSSGVRGAIRFMPSLSRSSFTTERHSA